jgi:hypothetical protein
LTVHVADDEDYFKFYANDTGGVADFVSVDFDTSEGNLDIQLLDSLGTVVDSSVSVTDTTETISLTGRPEGWYYVRVYSPSAALISDYTLTVDPPANAPPSVTVHDPENGTEFIIQGQETYTVTWDASDPEGDQTWATVYANTDPSFDGSEILLPTSVNTPGEQGFYVVNSAYLGVDTYWFYVALTDGGTTTGIWSNGNVKLLDITTGVDDTPEVASRLYPAVPNPFNPTTTLRIDLARASFAVWRIYDVRGRLVRELHRGDLAAGPHSRVWDGTDDRGRPVASGVYFQRVVAGEFRQTGKLVLLK